MAECWKSGYQKHNGQTLRFTLNEDIYVGIDIFNGQDNLVRDENYITSNQIHVRYHIGILDNC